MEASIKAFYWKRKNIKAVRELKLEEVSITKAPETRVAVALNKEQLSGYVLLVRPEGFVNKERSKEGGGN
ncbi:unnamed protein product [Cuscuta campestris]|uniref:Uncharacterized protein n=1 Tax=Cuscuta campestris TaxID=132261 RepID=A0A484NPG0_9ASTE|nr:unnamed protein product [Cuscuta campestris]